MSALNPLQFLNASKILHFFTLTPLLKRDIMTVQPHFVSPEAAPLLLPQIFVDFLAESLELSQDNVCALWGAYRHDIWAINPTTQTTEIWDLFRIHGWKRGISMCDIELLHILWILIPWI
jgi:hypothetical protein